MQIGSKIYGGGGGGVKSVQRGTATFTGNVATSTVTIAAVNTSKAICSYLGVQPHNGAVGMEALVNQMELTNATTLTFTRQSTAGAPSINWEVVEFN